MRQWSDGPVAVVVMGVSGAGKSAVGQQLAKRLGWNFVEGDALHSPENVAKMKSGQPLSDTDRAPWLVAIGQIIEDWRRRGERGVITCSALKQAYRRQLIGGHDDVRLVYLKGTHGLIAARLAARHGHFMPPSLLDSQFATLEPPGPGENPITVATDRSVQEIVNSVVSVLSSPARSPEASGPN